jgi:hypothetical protein
MDLRVTLTGKLKTEYLPEDKIFWGDFVTDAAK